MPRYIDADALWMDIIHNMDYCEDILEFIEAQPTADVVEVKHGFWYALEKGDRGYSAGDFKCSVCGEPNHTWIPKPNFCPNCGADMRKETEDEQS